VTKTHFIAELYSKLRRQNLNNFATLQVRIANWQKNAGQEAIYRRYIHIYRFLLQSLNKRCFFYLEKFKVMDLLRK